VPRLDHRPSGEERAWARRLAKRFGAENRLDDRTFVTKGTGSLVGGLDFESPKAQPGEELEALFKSVNLKRGRPAGRVRLGDGRGPGRGPPRPLILLRVQPRGNTAVHTL
jgi:hypothetical protein